MSTRGESRVALVTGATSGIGFHTARQLAARGASVLITGRDRSRGAEAVRSITADAGHSRVDFIQVDHSSVAANSGLGQQVTARLERLGAQPRLDVLVNNVGAVFPARTVTADGVEATLAVNFLAPVLVTGAVRPLLAGHCVNVTSSLGWLARQVPGGLLDDIQSTRDYVGIRAHARAKLLTAAWTIALSRDGLTAVTVNPGMAWTSLTRSLTPQVVPSWRYVYPLVRFFQQRADPAKAARVCVSLAWGDVVGGQYITERGRPGAFPALVTGPSVQDKVLDIAGELTRSAV